MVNDTEHLRMFQEGRELDLEVVKDQTWLLHWELIFGLTEKE